MDDQPSTATQIAERRQQLERYRTAYFETYGHAIDPGRHEAGDRVLANLRAGGTS